ncbi:MAG: OmpA family protein [Gemmatimonadaceae bacterium]
MHRPFRLSLLVVGAALAMGACKKKVVPVQTPTPEVVAPKPTEPPARPVTPVTPAKTDDAAEKAAAVAKARAVVLSTIYFEYDGDELKDDAKANLDTKLAILNANPSLRVRIAGHCDDRGSDEYNIALGRRRSEAAKRYLTDRGIDAARIETTTFGRERPAVQGSGEEAWSKNRRDEFEIIAGGDQLRTP